jgi:site-specific DNA recombinase
MKAVIYCRASTDKQETSCDQQEAACRVKAKELGATVTAVFKDDGNTGSDESRLAYQRMLTAANDKEFDTLLLWKLDRLNRDAPNREKATRRIEMHGVRIVTYKDYDSSQGSLKTRKLARGVDGLIGEYFINNLREEVHRGQDHKFSKGFWVGGSVYGYKLEPVYSETKLDANGKPEQTATAIKIDPAQAKIVREIFERFAAGASPNAIAKDLNKRNVPSPGSTWKRVQRRCDGWARSGIRVMIENPIYAGTLYRNRSQWVKPEDGKRRIRKERTKDDLRGTVGNAPHLAIVKETTWKLAQQRMNINRVKKPGDKRLISGGKAVYMLSGILKCGCGAHFVLDSATHYTCARHHDGTACTESKKLRVRRDLCERIILRPIVDDLLASALIDEMVKEMRLYYAQKMADAKENQAKVPAEVEELDQRIARLRVRLKAGDPDMSPEDIAAVIEKVEARKVEVLSAQPESKHQAKILRALPAAAREYRDQISKGFGGNVVEAGRARLAVHRLLGSEVVLRPAKDKTHLVAHVQFQRVALLGNVAAQQRFVGSGGRIACLSANR